MKPVSLVKNRLVTDSISHVARMGTSSFTPVANGPDLLIRIALLVVRRVTDEDLEIFILLGEIDDSLLNCLPDLKAHFHKGCSRVKENDWAFVAVLQRQLK